MRIKFLQTRRLSEDGFTVRRFHTGGIYDVADTAARSAVRQGWAVEVTEPDPADAARDSLAICIGRARAGRVA